MEMFTKIVNDQKFTFVCDGWSNSRAWGHLVILMDGAGREISRCKIRYYNRTWEAWRFQAACRGAVYDLISKVRREAVREYKDRTGKKRLTEDQKRAIYSARPDLVTLEMLQDIIRS